MNLAEMDAEERVALGYRAEANIFADEARRCREAGRDDDAAAALQSSFDLRLLAAGVERSHRGLSR